MLEVKDPPHDEALPRLKDALAERRGVLLQAPPGAGKSTLVPLALLESPGSGPPDPAARAAPRGCPRNRRRMAWLRNEAVGATVGFRMRLDTRVSRDTRIEVITEGVLTRMLHTDPELAGVGCVIFDEFHERSLQADLGLALCLDARSALEADFRVLAMSATLDGARVAALLGAAPVVDVPGRQHEIEIIYCAPRRTAPAGGADRGARRGLGRAPGDRETGGDLLVFLPGRERSRRLQGLLDRPGGAQLRCCRSMASWPRRSRTPRSTGPSGRCGAVVLATNIAETSLTIPA